MARIRTRIPLNVLLNGRLVGQLRRDTSGAIDFRYEPDWLAWEHAIPVSLSLPLSEQRYIGAPVVAVFDNLLPDNDDIRMRVAERSRAEGTDSYSLLSAIGRDCVGALQFVPDGEDTLPTGKLVAKPISNRAIGELLRNLERNPLGIDEDHDFRISLAGAQEKTALLYWNKKWHTPQGTTPTTHILKPQIGKLPNNLDLSDSVENEHLCLQLVGAFGLPVAQSKIVDFADERALVVERFDRFWTKDKRLLRVPQEDCCQALSVPPSRKYEVNGGPGIVALAQLLKGSDAPESDLKRLLKTQVLFWLLGATDGHAKNFSIRLAPGGRFVLTPVYDVLSVEPDFAAGRIRRNQMKLAMAVGTGRHYRLDQIAPRHFLQTAKLCGISDDAARLVMEEVADIAPRAIDKALAALPKGFPTALADAVIQGMKPRLNLFGRGETADQ